MYQNILGACVAIVGHNIVVFCAFFIANVGRVGALIPNC